MVIHTENLTGTVSGGSLAINTVAALQGIVREIVVSPTTPTTQYNLTITNADSLDVFISESNTGDFIEEVALPIRGIYTVTISSSTEDEVYSIAIIVEE